MLCDQPNNKKRWFMSSTVNNSNLIELRVMNAKTEPKSEQTTNATVSAAKKAMPQPTAKPKAIKISSPANDVLSNPNVRFGPF